MPTVTTSADAYQDLDRLRQRLDYQPSDFFSGDNKQLRYDELLVELEREARKIFETLWGDETPLTETERVDVIRTTDDAAIPLVYPINDVTEVEYKTTVGSDWEILDTDWYDSTEHRLILSRRPNLNSMRYRERANHATVFTQRSTWRDLAEKLRVTYDRGFGSEPPADIQSIQVDLINRFLRKRKREQTVAAASPDELAEMANMNEVLTDELRARIDDVTKPGYATFTV